MKKSNDKSRMPQHPPYGVAAHASPAAANQHSTQQPATAADVEAIVREALTGMRVYVLESDITSAQEAARAAVRQSYF